MNYTVLFDNTLRIIGVCGIRLFLGGWERIIWWWSMWVWVRSIILCVYLLALVLLFPLYPSLHSEFVPNNFTTVVCQCIVIEISYMLAHELSDYFSDGKYAEALGPSSPVRLYYYIEVNTLRGIDLCTLTYRTISAALPPNFKAAVRQKMICSFPISLNPKCSWRRVLFLAYFFFGHSGYFLS